MTFGAWDTLCNVASTPRDIPVAAVGRDNVLLAVQEFNGHSSLPAEVQRVMNYGSEVRQGDNVAKESSTRCDEPTENERDSEVR